MTVPDARPGAGEQRQVQTPPFIDTFDPVYDEDIHAILREARQESWYAATPVGVILLTYEDVHGFVRNPRLEEWGVDALRAAGITGGPLFEWSSLIMPHQPSDAHSRLRRLVSKAFTPRQVDRLRPAMRASAEALVAGIRPAGACEFVTDFAAPYPAKVISELLGIPPGDFEQFQAWSADLSLAFGSRIAEELSRIEGALLALSGYVDELLEVRRRTPGPDLISALLAAEEEGDRLSAEELRAMVTVLIFGGQDTTQCQLACALATFVDHPEQWRRLASDPEVVLRAVEEIVRYEPAGSGSPRIVTEHFIHKGVEFSEGTVVMPSAPAANRDPAAYPEPDRFDITRPGTTPPMTFGGGVHYCLGAALARAELSEALPILARALPEVTADGPVEWRHQALIRGPERLPIAFAAG